jgi:hypothetical protein
MSSTGRAASRSPAQGKEDSPVFPSRLERGALYAIGLETAAARGALWVAPIRAALAEGRPCVLITPLSPDQGTFATVLRQGGAPTELSAAFEQQRLKLFTANADHDTHLFRRGAAGYVQELDHFGIEDGALIVIDQSDDLFTPHDHQAVVQQARIYGEWARQRGHTMLLLFLRSSASRPILDGNQAALQHFCGVARVQPEANGLLMQMDFWRTPAGDQVGRSLSFGADTSTHALPPQAAGPATPADLPARGQAPATAEEGREGRISPRAPRGRQRVWYVGPAEAGLDALATQVQWLRARSINELLTRVASQKKGANALVALGESTDFGLFVQQMQDLRALLGPHARIVVRESRYRVREHLQRKLLLRAGVDNVLAAVAPPSTWAALLTGERVAPPEVITVPASLALEDWQPMLVEPPASGWLANGLFLQQADAALQRNRALEVPSTLAEVEVRRESDVDWDAAAACAARRGDLATRTADTLVFLLQGCRERDAVQVVNRWLSNQGLQQGVKRTSLFADEAIAERLDDLRQDLSDVPASAQTGNAHNVVTMPGSQRSVHSRVLIGPLLASLLALALLPAPAPALAQTGAGTGTTAAKAGRKARTPLAARTSLPEVGAQLASSDTVPAAAATTTAPASPAPPAPADSATQAYEEARYAEAARLGLAEIQQRPGDHDLRLRLANSLAWTGDYPRAIEHYGALAGTRLAREGRLGIAHVRLWSGRPELADPLFRSVLAQEPGHVEARAGLAAAGRHLRPRSTVQLGHVGDSSEARRSSLTLSHRWWHPDLAQVFELTAEGRHETDAPGQVSLNPRELGLRYEHRGLSWAPQLQVTAQQQPQTRLFGEAGVRLLDGSLSLRAGRVNWGQLAFSPRALQDGLTARLIELGAQADHRSGQWQGQWTRYAVSDGNRIDDASLRVTPAWQPLPARLGLKAFAGLSARRAERAEARYWSPADGHYTANLGLAWGRWEAQWELQGELKRSQRLGGEGANGWALSAGGKRWLSADWALRAEASHETTRRGQSSYRATSVLAALEKLW